MVSEEVLGESIGTCGHNLNSPFVGRESDLIPHAHGERLEHEVNGYKFRIRCTETCTRMRLTCSALLVC